MGKFLLTATVTYRRWAVACYLLVPWIVFLEYMEIVDSIGIFCAESKSDELTAVSVRIFSVERVIAL